MSPRTLLFAEIEELSATGANATRAGAVGFQQEGTLDSQNLSPLTCPLA
jgi:hypothetical protein